MNIGIYGPSIAKYNGEQSDHFITLLKDYFNAKIVHSGIVQCSEERILFNLKKTKSLDLAIIFHAPPYNMFVPTWNRDITGVDKETFNKKITVRDWLVNEIGISGNEDSLEDYISNFSKIPNGACWQLLEEYGLEFENYTTAFEEWCNGDSKNILEIIQTHARSVNNDERFYKELFDALDLFKKYLNHPDLMFNRYYGAIAQIDQYLHYKKIPCIHFLDKEQWYPQWLEFKSGPVDRSISKMHKENSQLYIGYDNSSNALNSKGNKIIFDRILELLATSNIMVNVLNDQLGNGGSIPPVAPKETA